MKKPIVLVIINQKGGVGKTTTAINLTAGLKLMGKKVLGIDLDPQGHFSKFIGISTTGKGTITELMKKETTFDKVLIQTKYGDIIPSDNRLQDYLMKLTTDINGIYAIQKLVNEVGERYDYVVIDCPPAVNHFTLAALAAGTKIIIPTECEYLSIDGVNMIIETIEAIKERLNPNLKVEGILLVKYQPRRGLTQDVETFLEKVAKTRFKSKVFQAKIRATVDVPTSQGFKQSVFEYNPKSNASKDYAKLVKEIVGVE